VTKPKRDPDFTHSEMEFYFKEMLQYNKRLDILFNIGVSEQNNLYYIWDSNVNLYVREVGNIVDIAYDNFVNSLIEESFNE